jgi:predicted small lipoprotein YifL
VSDGRRRRLTQSTQSSQSKNDLAFSAGSAFSALLVVIAFALSAGACGKKGPPLPPLIRLPAPPEIRADRRGSTVELALVVPGANVDGTRPANLSRVDAYALTGSPGFTEEDLLKHGTRVASLEVKAPRDPDDTVEPGEPAEDVPPPEGAGLDQGAKTTVEDRLDAAALTPADLRADKSRQSGASGSDRPLLGPSTTAVRTYMGVGINTRGRKGRFSSRVAVSLAPPPQPPPTPTVTYTETAITVAWTLPAVTDAAAQSPENAVLPSRELGALRPALAYNVYDSTAGTLLTPTPVTEPRFTDPRITWGEERCYVVRAVEKIGAMSVESESQPARCTKLVDIFPPAAPKDLKAVSSEGVISLIWEASPESDLAGYIILRAQAPAEPETPIVPAPVLETSFNDTVQPGVRFVYAVRAVDKAGNASAPSNRVEETAR